MRYSVKNHQKVMKLLINPTNFALDKQREIGLFRLITYF